MPVVYSGIIFLAMSIVGYIIGYTCKNQKSNWIFFYKLFYLIVFVTFMSILIYSWLNGDFSFCINK